MNSVTNSQTRCRSDNVSPNSIRAVSANYANSKLEKETVVKPKRPSPGECCLSRCKLIPHQYLLPTLIQIFIIIFMLLQNWNTSCSMAQCMQQTHLLIVQSSGNPRSLPHFRTSALPQVGLTVSPAIPLRDETIFIGWFLIINIRSKKRLAHSVITNQRLG